MTIIKKLNEEIQKWDKMEGAGAVYWMYGWGKKNLKQDEDILKNEKEEPEERDRTQGERNAKYLDKARFYANTDRARLKRQRTELRKDLNGDS